MATTAVIPIVLSSVGPAAAVGLDAIQNVFSGSTANFEAIAAQWSAKIFYSIIILDLLWTLYECIRTNSLEQLLDTLMYRVVGYALGVYLITNQVAITNAVVDAAGEIAAAFADLKPGTVLTPNAIAALGWDAVDAMNNAVPPNPAIGVLIAIPLFFTSMLVQLAFVVVAIEDLIIHVGVQLCIAVGSVLFGLVATRWTRPIAAIWPKMIVASFLLTVVIAAVAGLGSLISQEIISEIAAMRGADFGSILQDLATMTVASLVYLLVSIFLTGLAAFMGAQTPLSVGGAVINAVTNSFAYVTGYNAGSHGGSGNAASSGGGHAIATIEAATTTSG